MRPVTIPDELIQPGTVRRVFAAPNGDLTDDQIRPAEALIRRGEDDLAVISCMLELEPGDLERLQSGGRVWLTMVGGLAPFDVTVLDEGQVP
jgi:hypothetical protein